jgi:hypothetical protein
LSVHDDLQEDLPHIYPGLTRPELEALLHSIHECWSEDEGVHGDVAVAIYQSVRNIG